MIYDILPLDDLLLAHSPEEGHKQMASFVHDLSSETFANAGGLGLAENIFGTSA